jgi:hypothetical protein
VRSRDVHDAARFDGPDAADAPADVGFAFVPLDVDRDDVAGHVVRIEHHSWPVLDYTIDAVAVDVGRQPAWQYPGQQWWERRQKALVNRTIDHDP